MMMTMFNLVPREVRIGGPFHPIMSKTLIGKISLKGSTLIKVNYLHMQKTYMRKVMEAKLKCSMQGVKMSLTLVFQELVN